MNCGLRHFGNDVMQLSYRICPRIWRDFGTALPFQTRLTQTKPVLPLSNEHGSQVKDQGGRQCCHNKHKKFPYRRTRDVSLVSWHVSYIFVLMFIRESCGGLVGANCRTLYSNWGADRYRWSVIINTISRLIILKATYSMDFLGPELQSVWVERNARNVVIGPKETTWKTLA